MAIEVDPMTAVTVAGGGTGLIGLVTWFIRVINGQRITNQGIAAVDVANAGSASLIDHLTGEISRQNETIKELARRVTQVEADKQTVEDRAHELDKAAALQSQKVEGLLVEIKTLNDQLRNREHELHEAERRIGELERQIVGLERRRPDHSPRPEMGVPLRRVTDVGVDGK